MAVITVTAAEKTLRRPFPMQDCDDTSAMSDEQNGGNGRKLTMQYLWLKGCLGKEVVNPKKGKCETNRRQDSQHGKTSNLARLGHFLLFLLLMIQAQAASATEVSETDRVKKSLDAAILDADEVRRVTKNEDRMCDFSGRGYTSVSDDAFHLVSCEVIDLSLNNISHLPEGLFSLACRLRRIDLRGNPFREAPVIKNAVVEIIILDQTPVISIPENYTDHLPKLRAMYLENGLFRLKINIRAFNCGCVKNSIQIYLDGTVSDLISSCPEDVKVTTEEGAYTPSVTVTCGNGSHVTFVSLNGTVRNESIAPTTETTSDLGTVLNEIVAATTKTTSDPGTPYSTLPSEMSTPETPIDSQNFASKKRVLLIVGTILVVLAAICGFAIGGLCLYSRFCKSSTPVKAIDNGEVSNGANAAVELGILGEGGV